MHLSDSDFNSDNAAKSHQQLGCKTLCQPQHSVTFKFQQISCFQKDILKRADVLLTNAIYSK